MWQACYISEKSTLENEAAPGSVQIGICGFGLFANSEFLELAGFLKLACYWLKSTCSTNRSRPYNPSAASFFSELKQADSHSCVLFELHHEIVDS